jgi:riboflavin kinase
MRLEVRGRVFSGIGKGRYYVGHPEYQRRFRTALGYTPYPGTLNVKLEDDEMIETLKKLRGLDGTKIESFSSGDESFSALTCFSGEMDGERVTLLFIDVTHYNDSVVELISPIYLRNRFGLKDQDVVFFALDAPDQIKSP